MNETACEVGIDVAKRKFDIALLINNKIKAKVFDNTPSGHKAFAEWFGERGAIPEQTHLCMEATGPYSEILATSLVAAGWRVSVVNPARIKGFAQGELARHKTDRADAALLARFCAAMRPSLWTPPPVEWRELRGWGGSPASTQGNAPAGEQPQGSPSGERASSLGTRCPNPSGLAQQTDQGT